jgi:repressor LexA
MVIALLHGENATLKKLYRDGPGRIRLQPANVEMQPIFVSEEDLLIRGVVIGVLRKY